MCKILGHIVNIVILGALLSLCIDKVLNFLPYLGVSLVLISPIYGAIRMVKNKIIGTSKILNIIKYIGSQIHRIGKSSYLYWMSIVIAIYGNIDLLINSIGSVVVFSGIFFIGGSIFWTITRQICKICFSYEIPTYIEAFKHSF